jgi:hypothetical protein
MKTPTKEHPHTEMAPQKQQTRPANPSSVSSSNGRGGDQTSSRGNGKKGHGRYDSKNNWRASPNGTYGPRLTPVVPAAASFPQGPPALWRSQYGSYPVSVDHATAILQPLSDYAVSSRDASYKNNPTYTAPIASPTVHIAIPANENMSSPATTTDAGAQAAATSSESMNSPSAYESSKVAPKSPEATLNPDTREGQILDNTIDQLDYEKLMHLQIYNISLAAKLQQNLKEAKEAHQARQFGIRKRQGTLRESLRTAIMKEHALEMESKDMHNHFYYDMTEACKIDGDEKSAAQLRATEHLKSLTDLSLKASVERAKIDKFRNEMQELDNSHANSRNAYANALHDVLMMALGSNTTEAYAAANRQGLATSSKPTEKHTVSTEEASKTKASSSISGAQKHRQDITALSYISDSQQYTQQPVFQRQPETEHRGIREILDGVNIAENPVEEVQSAEKNKGKSRKVVEKQVVAAREQQKGG